MTGMRSISSGEATPSASCSPPRASSGPAPSPSPLRPPLSCAYVSRPARLLDHVALGACRAITLGHGPLGCRLLELCLHLC
eukprot:3790508-Rhodomonas_salina.1